MIRKRIEKICDEYWLIENYERAVADKTQVWECHHLLEIQDDKILSYKELIDNGLYFNRPPEELIFLTKSDHNKLHKIGNTYRRGKKISDETRQKMRAAQTGNTNMLGKKHSDESKRKMREAHIGKKHSDETKQKMQEAQKGKKLLKYSFIDPNGEIHIMDKSNAKKWHPDWKLIEDAQ